MNQPTQPTSPPALLYLATPYTYAALLDAEGNEQPITDSMVACACDQAFDALYTFLPQRFPARQASQQA